MATTTIITVGETTTGMVEIEVMGGVEEVRGV